MASGFILGSTDLKRACVWAREAQTAVSTVALFTDSRNLEFWYVHTLENNYSHGERSLSAFWIPGSVLSTSQVLTHRVLTVCGSENESPV